MKKASVNVKVIRSKSGLSRNVPAGTASTFEPQEYRWERQTNRPLRLRCTGKPLNPLGHLLILPILALSFRFTKIAC